MTLLNCETMDTKGVSRNMGLYNSL